MRVALFDIDGTLVWTHGAGRRAMQRALISVVGSAGPDHHRYDGKTDRQIVREAMALDGLPTADTDAHIDAVLGRYVEELAAELDVPDHGAELLPGVRELLDAVEARDDVLLALLTGNVVSGAERKLRAVGVDPSRFAIGAFGDDHEHRHELPAIACARAIAHLGAPVAGSACVIIGDTPNDVACGRSIGARAVAVATGSYDVATLRACGADFVFSDLTDTRAVMRAIADA